MKTTHFYYVTNTLHWDHPSQRTLLTEITCLRGSVTVVKGAWWGVEGSEVDFHLFISDRRECQLTRNFSEWKNIVQNLVYWWIQYFHNWGLNKKIDWLKSFSLIHRTQILSFKGIPQKRMRGLILKLIFGKSWLNFDLSLWLYVFWHFKMQWLRQGTLFFHSEKSSC